MNPGEPTDMLSGVVVSGSDLTGIDLALKTELVPPVVTVSTPNGGAAIQGGGSYEITWTATDETALAASPIAIEYSTDGSTYIPIAAGEDNDGTYTWTPVPDISSTTVTDEIYKGVKTFDITHKDLRDIVV